MKIVFIGGRDLKNLGGIENYMLNLATQLVKMGHTPIVFCESDHNGITTINGFQVINQKGFKSNFICKPLLGLKATIKTILCFHDADIIHYNAWPPSLWSPIARLFGFKCVMQGHGLEWKRSKYSPFQQKILKFMEWLTAHINKNLIMCSEDQTHYFKEKYNKQAVTIPTAINIPNLKDHNDSEILNRYSLSSKGYFLFLARLVKDKNPDYLIKAFVKSRHQDKKLVIAGNNDADIKYVNYLYQLAKDCTDVVFTGAVYGEEKEALLRNAYSFCIPSTIEGLSISLLEAMSHSLPIIASDINANKEVLDLDKALWVRPENEDDLRSAIEKSVENPCSIVLPLKYNYNYVKNNYTWEIVANRYVKYLNTICK